MATATIDIPDAAYRRARRAAKAQGVSFEAFALAAICRAAPPPVARRAAAIPKGMTAEEFFARLPIGGAESARDDDWLADCKRASGSWADEVRDPWA